MISKQEGFITDDRLIKILLTFISGVYDCSGVLIIGTTNYIEKIPDSFIRERPFSDQIKIRLPSFEDRIAIIKMLIQQYMVSIHDHELIPYTAK